MRDARDRMVRNAASLMAQRVALLLLGIGYAIVVPRMLGPEDYGRFGLLISITLWLLTLGDFGLPTAVMRHVSGKSDELTADDRRRLLGSLVGFRAVVGLIAGAAMVALARLCVPDATAALLLLFGLVVYLDGVIEPFFTWQIGLNRTDLWGTNFLLRRLCYLVTIPVGYHFWGLPGAPLGMLLAHVLLIAVGARLAASDFRWRAVAWRPGQILPLIRFGLPFWIGNLLAALFRYSGETVVKVFAGDYRQVAFFGLALNVFFAAEGGLAQCLIAASPFLSRLQSLGHIQRMTTWFERLLCALTVLAMPAVFFVWFFAEAITPVLFGDAFLPASRNLPVVVLALLPSIAFGAVATASAATRTPRNFLVPALVRAALFVPSAAILARVWGSFGACLALLGALLVSCGLGLWMTSRVMPFSPRRWLTALGLAAPFFLLRGLAADALLFGGSVVGYAALVLATRTITLDEIREAWHAIRGAPDRDALTTTGS